MKNRIILFLITCIFIILHVHVSVCTGGNTANPVHVCLLFAAAGLTNEFYVFYISSYVIQSFITILIAFLLLNYKRLWLWLAVVVVFFPLAFLFKTTIHDDHLILATHINAIDQFYERVYDDLAINAFTHIFCFSTTQLLLLATYTISDYIVLRKKAESYNEISIKSKGWYIVLIVLFLSMLYLATFPR